MARTHALDTDWFEDIRERQRELYPALADAPKGCHFWWNASFPHLFLDQFSEKVHRLWINAGPAPVSEAGSRLVTMHGDVHRGNVLRTNNGLQLVDYEAACVTFAIQDFAHSLELYCDTNNELKQAFAKAYLLGCGLRALEEDIFALRLDAERCKMATNWFNANTLCDFVYTRRNHDDLGTVYPALVAIADRARLDPELAREIVERGFERCAAALKVNRDVGRNGLHRQPPAAV